MKESYPLFKVHYDLDAVLDGIRNVFESGFINEGEQVIQFADRLKDLLGSEQLITVNSCTSALTMALRLAGVGPGDEVITSPMTCIASNTPIINAGADIVWADIDADSASISADDIKAKITPRTKAVICVDWAGTPVELDTLWQVCKDVGVPLIQDAAHAFGAQYKDESIALRADYTCYSFQAIKHISCGDGGALVVHDPERFSLAKKLKWFGYDREASKDEKGNWKGQRWDADIEVGEVGYKFNMNNISAAIGLSQLPHADRIVGTHRSNAAKFDEAFSDNNLIRPLTRPKGSVSSFWVYTVMLSEHLDRDAILEKLNAENILAGLVHLPNDDYSCFTKYKMDLAGVKRFAAHQLSLPCGWWLCELDIAHIASRLKAHCEA